ncbi:hypothetical protein L211DRAFT_898948 [Terfezia boudieri ATCC MYA-4762]|uniref:Uncharacterized protein n=1 Tax=Terfezia boudieri ATCC MYA-4762 TaxID=1051890 RepID=A0A3N4LVI7_9PEZI|nr:hypothetical protein L211DRAFT_898948 [Terfezia boudieri ATCC MYA-4762]
MSSTFFMKPDDYTHEAPYTHPLLTGLWECTWFIHRLRTKPSPYLPDYPEIRNQVKMWREKMFQALMPFFWGAMGQPKTLGHLVPGPKVSMLQAFHAIQTYATLVHQIQEAQAEFKDAKAHAEAANMAEVWLEMWTDLQTVEYRMKRFIKQGEMPEDKDIDIMLIYDNNVCLSSEYFPKNTKFVSAPLRSYTDQSAFFDLLEDYETAPFSHRLLEPLLSARQGLLRLAKLQIPPNEACSGPLEHLAAWYREMHCALAAFHRDVFEPSTLRNNTTGSSSKVKVIRALFAIRCYATLVKQIEFAKVALRSVPSARITLDARIVVQTVLETVEVKMHRFFMEGLKPMDQDILVSR